MAKSFSAIFPLDVQRRLRQRNLNSDLSSVDTEDWEFTRARNLILLPDIHNKVVPSTNTTHCGTIDPAQVSQIFNHEQG